MHRRFTLGRVWNVLFKAKTILDALVQSAFFSATLVQLHIATIETLGMRNVRLTAFSMHRPQQCPSTFCYSPSFCQALCWIRLLVVSTLHIRVAFRTTGSPHEKRRRRQGRTRRSQLAFGHAVTWPFHRPPHYTIEMLAIQLLVLCSAVTASTMRDLLGDAMTLQRNRAKGYDSEEDDRTSHHALPQMGVGMAEAAETVIPVEAKKERTGDQLAADQTAMLLHVMLERMEKNPIVIHKGRFTNDVPTYSDDDEDNPWSDEEDTPVMSSPPRSPIRSPIRSPTPNRASFPKINVNDVQQQLLLNGKLPGASHPSPNRNRMESVQQPSSILSTPPVLTIPQTMPPLHHPKPHRTSSVLTEVARNRVSRASLAELPSMSPLSTLPSFSSSSSASIPHPSSNAQLTSLPPQISTPVKLESVPRQKVDTRPLPRLPSHPIMAPTLHPPMPSHPDTSRDEDLAREIYEKEFNEHRQKEEMLQRDYEMALRLHAEESSHATPQPSVQSHSTPQKASTSAPISVHGVPHVRAPVMRSENETPLVSALPLHHQHISKKMMLIRKERASMLSNLLLPVCLAKISPTSTPPSPKILISRRQLDKYYGHRSYTDPMFHSLLEFLANLSKDGTYLIEAGVSALEHPSVLHLKRTLQLAAHAHERYGWIETTTYDASPERGALISEFLKMVSALELEFEIATKENERDQDVTRRPFLWSHLQVIGSELALLQHLRDALPEMVVTQASHGRQHSHEQVMFKSAAPLGTPEDYVILVTSHGEYMKPGMSMWLNHRQRLAASEVGAMQIKLMYHRLDSELRFIWAEMSVQY